MTNQSDPAAREGLGESVGWVTSTGDSLFRRWIRPAGAVSARLLFLHGYGDHSGRYPHFFNWLAGRRIACDAFDFRGHGRSTGVRAHVRDWPLYLDDLRAALAAVKTDAQATGIGDVPLFVLGHSHGGLVLAAAVTRGVLTSADVAGCVLSAPYLRSAERLSWLWRGIAAVTSVIAPSIHISNGLSQEMMSHDPAMREESRNDPLLLRTATPGWYAGTMRMQDEVMASADRFRLPVLGLMGDADPIADLAAARDFVDRAASTDKAFEVLPGSRHEILRETDREKVFERIYDWMSERI